MKRKMLIAVALAATACMSGVALAAGPQDRSLPGAGRSVPPPPPIIDRYAMQNLIVAELAQRTGRPAADIERIVGDRPPHLAADELGIDHQTMRSICEHARTTLIDEAQQAQMITAAQASTLKAMPPPPPPAGGPAAGNVGPDAASQR